MNAPDKFLEDITKQTIKFKLNGKDTEAFSGETILDVADREGLEVPRLCYKDGYRPDGNCRSCVVEVKGELLPMNKQYVVAAASENDS